MAALLPIHPRLVHFPIALLVVGSLAALAYLTGWRRPMLPVLAWSCMVLGWLALFLAILTGLIDQNSAPQDEAVVAVLNPHIAAGLGLAVVYGLLLYERLRNPLALDDQRLRIRLILLLLLGVALILVEGWLGGKLVYDLGVGVQQASLEPGTLRQS